MISKNPITSLYDRVTSTFENVNRVSGERLKSYAPGKLSRKIRIDTGKFAGPCSDHDTKEIVLNQKFLTLVWCITYIIYEVAGNKAKTANRISPTYMEIDGSDPEVQQLNLLFDWAFSLKTGGSEDWPEELPRPDSLCETVRIVNIIFIDAITYIMYHEVAHLVNDHWDSYKEIGQKINNGIELTEGESTLSKQLEQEADSFAYESLVMDDDREDTRYHKLFGMIMAGVSSLFAQPARSKLVTNTHPGTHVRIFNTRLRTSFTEGNEFWLNQVMKVGLSMFCRLQKIHYEDTGLNSDSEILDYLFDQIHKISTENLPH